MEKKEYVCAICGTHYNDLRKYVECVTNCYKKQREAEEIARKRREKLNREDEIDKSVEEVYRLVMQYRDEYGTYPNGWWWNPFENLIYCEKDTPNMGYNVAFFGEGARAHVKHKDDHGMDKT